MIPLWLIPTKACTFGGIPITELASRLPEEIFYLLCTGELPDGDSLSSLQQDLRSRGQVPGYVWDVLRAMPEGSHPMTMFDTAILVMEHDSVFRRRYAEGMRKEEFWEAALEDSLQMLAKLPCDCRRHLSNACAQGPADRVRGQPRLGSRLRAHAGLARPGGKFRTIDAPLPHLTLRPRGRKRERPHLPHGVIRALRSILCSLGRLERLGGAPARAGQSGMPQLCSCGAKEIQWRRPPTSNCASMPGILSRTATSSPGYGHAVLRITDPRFTAFHKFGDQVCAQDEMFRIVDRIFAIVPGILKEQGKAKDPWPNVDAISGALLYHFGLTEFDYYTVLFGVSRALGLCAQLIINRALGTPITRPKSVSTDWIKAKAGQAQRAA